MDIWSIKITLIISLFIIFKHHITTDIDTDKF